jgi:hypothetical protein
MQRNLVALIRGDHRLQIYLTPVSRPTTRCEETVPELLGEPDSRLDAEASAASESSATVQVQTALEIDSPVGAMSLTKSKL